MVSRGGWGKGGATGRWLLGVGVALLIPACSEPPEPDEQGGLLQAQALAPDTEVRDFAILVDQKPAGRCRMEVARRSDGTLVMSGRADVQVRYLIYTYTYWYRGTEESRNGRLVGLHSRANDDGKRFALTAVPRRDGLHVTVNGRERVTRPDVWTTSYWRLPAGPCQDRAVLLLDADTGKETQGRLRYLGAGSVQVAGRERPVAHYRVTGPPSPVDLWYDGQRRLVRQDYIEDGHRTVLELRKLIRAAR